MSIQNNFPAIRPSLLLDFAKVQALDPRVTFARASTATFTNSLGLIQTAASGVPRFDFNPTTDECNGLLIEEQRTNLLTYSDLSLNSFTDGVTVTTNSIVSPDGTVNATLLTSTVTGGSNTCYADRGATVTTSTTYSYSVFLKAGTSPVSTINLYFTGGAFRQAVGTITWSTLAYTVTSTDSTATGTITNVGNGWYRLTLTYDSGNNVNSVSRVYVRSQGSSNVAGETVYAWGRQTEAGAFSTSYIPTVASQVTRAADSASMTGTNFSSWYNQAEGTLYADVVYSGGIIGTPAELNSIFVSDGTGANYISLRVVRDLSSPQADVLVIKNSVVQMDSGGFQPVISGTVYKRAFGYRTNDAQQCVNGVLESADTIFDVPTVNRLSVPGTNANFYIRKLAYYPIRCTNAQLQALTR